MKLPTGGVLADAAALWRAERDVIVRIAGMFFLLPILALAMLASGLPLTETMTREEVQKAFSAFYLANIGWFMLISLALDFGVLMLLAIFLQPGKTVRDLLLFSTIRLVPFLLISFANGALINLGFLLYVIPGIYIFGRTWMMGPAYAAQPERGLFAAVEGGFRLGKGNGWRIALIGCGTAIIAGAAAIVLLIVTQALTVLAGNAQWAQALLLVPVAVAGAAAYVAFTLVRVAAYRRLAASSNGM